MPPKKRRGVRRSTGKLASAGEEPTVVYSECLDSDDEKNSEDSVNLAASPQKDSTSPPAALRRSSRRLVGNTDNTTLGEPSPTSVSGPKARRGRGNFKRILVSPKFSSNTQDITITTDSEQQSYEEEHKDNTVGLDKYLQNEEEITDSSSSLLLDEDTKKLNIINNEKKIVIKKKFKSIEKKDDETLDNASGNTDCETSNHGCTSDLGENANVDNDTMDFSGVETNVEGNEVINKTISTECNNEVDSIAKLDETAVNINENVSKVDDTKGANNKASQLDKNDINKVSKEATVKDEDSTNEIDSKMNIETEKVDDITKLDESVVKNSVVSKIDVEIKDDNEIIKVDDQVADDAKTAIQVDEATSEDVTCANEIVEAADDVDIESAVEIDDEASNEIDIVADEIPNATTDEIDDIAVDDNDNETADDIEVESPIEIDDEFAEEIDVSSDEIDNVAAEKIDVAADEIDNEAVDEIDDVAVDEINNEAEDVSDIEAVVEVDDEAAEEIDKIANVSADEIDDVSVDEIEDVAANDNDNEAHSEIEVEATVTFDNESVNKIDKHEVDIINESAVVVEDGVKDRSITAEDENKIAVTENEEFTSKVIHENEGEDDMEVDDNDSIKEDKNINKIIHENEEDDMEVDDIDTGKEDKNIIEEENDDDIGDEVVDIVDKIDDDIGLEIDDDIEDEIDDDIGIEVDDDITYEDDCETASKTEVNRTLESDMAEKNKTSIEILEESVKGSDSEFGIENNSMEGALVAKERKDDGEKEDINENSKKLKAGDTINDQKNKNLDIDIVNKNEGSKESIDDKLTNKKEGKQENENNRNEKEKRIIDKTKDDKLVKDQRIEQVNKVVDKNEHSVVDCEGKRFLEIKNKTDFLKKGEKNLNDHLEERKSESNEKSKKLIKEDENNVNISEAEYSRRVSACDDIRGSVDDELIYEGEDSEEEIESSQEDLMKSKSKKTKQNIDDQLVINLSSENILSESEDAQNRKISDKIKNKKDEISKDLKHTNKIDAERNSGKEIKQIEGLGAGEKTKPASIKKNTETKGDDDDDIVILEDDKDSSSKSLEEKSSKTAKQVIKQDSNKTGISMATKNLNELPKESKVGSKPVMKSSSVSASVKETDKKSVAPAKEAPSETSVGSAIGKSKPTPAPAAAADQNKIPGRAYIIGIRGAASEGKKTLFDCILCFDGMGNCVPGPIINKHIKSKEHALKVMEITSQDLYNRYKDDDKAGAEEVVNAILKYEETQKRQTLVLATKDTYKAQRQLLVSKLSLLNQRLLNADSGKAPPLKVKPNTDKLQPSKVVKKTNETVKSASEISKSKLATEVNVKSKQVSTSEVPLRLSSIKGSAVGSKPSAPPIPAALSTLNFLSSLKGKGSVDESKSTDGEKKTTAQASLSKEEMDKKKYAAQEALSVQLAKKQKYRKPDKIVLVMDGRDVYVDTDKLGCNVRVLRIREAMFSNLFSFIKSDEWFGKGTMFIFLNGEYTCMRIRKHSMCSQYKCEIPVNVCHIEKELLTYILIDEALKLHKEILDNTTNDQVLFCELIPINIDSTNVLRIDRRVCFNTHPIDFHKKVPSYLMERYLACIKEFNEFARKYAIKLDLPFWDMMKSTFTSDISDIQRTFIHLKKDGMSFKSIDYVKRTEAIVAKITVLLGRLRKSSSGIDASLAHDMKNKPTIEGQVKSFEKVIIFANCYYKEALKNFAAPNVEIIADEDLKFDSISNLVSEKSKVMPQNTLWLTLIGSFCISEIKYLDACTSATSTCVKPLITLIPSPDVKTSSLMNETINKIRTSTLALLKTVRDIIPRTSAFFVLPPYPPTIISEYKYPHATLHKMASNENQVYVASDMIIGQLGVAFSKLNKEIISLISSELKERSYPHEPLWKYAQSLPQCHMQVVRTKDDSTNALFCKWKACISELISKFLVTSPKNETEYLTRMILSPSKDLYDHFVFIGLQEQLSQISYSKSTSLSLWAIKYPYDVKDIQAKVSSLLPLSGKRILFVIFGDFSMINLEITDYQCKTLKCTNAISFMKLRSEKVKVLIEEKLEVIRKLVERVKGVFKGTSSIIMAPLFSRYCVQKIQETSETVHRTLHVVLKNSSSPCILDGEKAIWEERVEEFQDFWNSALLRNLDTCEPIRNLIENYLSVDIPLIQWIKPVVAPLSNKSAKYSIQGLFDKLVETAYSKTLNNELPSLTSSDLSKTINQIQEKKTNTETVVVPVAAAKEVKIPTQMTRTTSQQSNVPSKTSTTSSSSSLYNNSSQSRECPPVNYNYNFQMQGNPYNAFGMNGSYYPQQQNPYPYYSQPPSLMQQPPYFQQPPPSYVQQPSPVMPPQHLPVIPQQQPPVMPPQPAPIMPPRVPSVIPLQQPPPLVQQSLSSGFNTSSQSSYQYGSTSSATYNAPPALYSQPRVNPAVNVASISLIPTPPVASNQIPLPSQSSHVAKSIPKTEVKPSTASVPKKIQVQRPKALTDFLLEFYSSSRKERPFEYAYIIGKKEMIHSLSELNLKNVTLIYQNLSMADEGQTSYILNKIGSRPIRSVCFLAFGLSVITKTLPLTPGCQKFKCKQPVPGSCLKSHTQDKSTNLTVIKRIKEVVLLGSKLSEYLPVVILPIYPSRVFCDDGAVVRNHRICHAIAEKDSYALVGTEKDWEEHICVFLQTWNNFMKVHHDKFSYPKAIPKFPYYKDTIKFGQSVSVFFDDDYAEPAIWEDTVSNILKILMTYTENAPKSLDSPLTIASGKQYGSTANQGKEIFGNASATSAIDESVAIVSVKISNVSDVVPEEFFTTLFSTIYKNASLKKYNGYFIVQLTRVSALLLVNKVNNFIIGDAAVKVEFAEPQSVIPALTLAQDKYMASIFNEIYLRYKSQIIQNIKIKLAKVVDSSNYKTELCDGSCNGQTTSCNFYHSSNDRRRNPILYKYMQKMCSHPNTKYNPCLNGEKCIYAHNIYEQMFYPTNFQTIICPMHDKNTMSSDGICKFAHADTPEVFYTSSWTDLVMFGTQNTFHFVVGAIRALQKLAGKKDVKICLISQNTEIIDIVEQVIKDILTQSGLKCANLLKTLVPTGPVEMYGVFLGNPYSIAMSQSESRHPLLSITEIGALIVDDINGILASPVDGEHLLKICKTLRIGAGQKSLINKVFVANNYDPSITGVISRFLGIPLKEVKEQANASVPASIVPPAKKETPAPVTSVILSSSSSSRSRSASRERQSKSRRKTSTTSAAKSRKSRSSSRSRRHRSGSRSRKRRSRSRSSSRTRRDRSSSRSRRHRSSSRSRKNRNRSRSKSTSKTGKRARSPSPALEKLKKVKSGSQQFSYTGVTIPSIGNALTKLPESTSSLQEKLGNDLYRKFLEEQKGSQHTHEEEYRAFKAFPELHSSYEMFYEEFLSEYNKKYGRNTKEEQKDQHWRRFWDTRIQMLKDLDWKKKSEKLEKEYSEKAKIYNIPVQSNPSLSLPSTSNPSVTKTESFSVEKTLTLLAQLSSKLGMLGPALTAIINSAREKGINDKGLAVFTDEENLVLIKMVTDKMKSLEKISSPALVADLTLALDWTTRLLEYAKNPPKTMKEESSLNLMAIAKASLGKDSGFTLNLIKTALAYEGLSNKSKEEINQLFLEVCKIHFEMAMPEKYYD